MFFQTIVPKISNIFFNALKIWNNTYLGFTEPLCKSQQQKTLKENLHGWH